MSASIDAAHGHGSRRTYLIGFLLSVVLTAVPFWLVMTGALHDAQTTAILIIGFAVVQIAQRGATPENRRRLLCLSMFWHFLDVVWIGVFTFVYLLGMIR